MEKAPVFFSHFRFEWYNPNWLNDQANQFKSDIFVQEKTLPGWPLIDIFACPKSRFGNRSQNQMSKVAFLHNFLNAFFGKWNRLLNFKTLRHCQCVPARHYLERWFHFFISRWIIPLNFRTLRHCQCVPARHYLERWRLGGTFLLLAVDGVLGMALQWISLLE